MDSPGVLAFLRSLIHRMLNLRSRSWWPPIQNHPTFGASSDEAVSTPQTISADLPQQSIIRMLP
jgi:hypothetical protein